MLLRRITQHVKDQNWFAVGIDFCIVVLGIFVGLLANDWRQSQQDRAAESDILLRLHDDVKTAVSLSEDRIERRRTYFETASVELVEFFEHGKDSLSPGQCPSFYGSAFVQIALPELPTQIDISSTGRLELIRNPGIRASLLELQQRTAIAKDFIDQTQDKLVELPERYPEILTDARMNFRSDGEFRFSYVCDEQVWADIPAVKAGMANNADIADAFLNAYVAQWSDQLNHLHALLDEELSIGHNSEEVE